MKKDKLSERMAQLESALARLQEMLATSPNHIGRTDAVIQRFEFVFELFWKNFKQLLERDGINTTTPREAIANAYRVGWITAENVWIDMMADRNLSSHTYNEALAEAILARIEGYAPTLTQTFAAIRSKI